MLSVTFLIISCLQALGSNSINLMKMGSSFGFFVFLEFEFEFL